MIRQLFQYFDTLVDHNIENLDENYHEENADENE